ncbi:hypothetical protein ACSSS7_002682 [Eimeria intestinalis]
MEDPELWGHLTLGLSTALKTAEHRATLIVQVFLRILKATDEIASRALVSACFPNIVGSLELLRPSHCSSAGLLQALSRCISFPGVLSEVADSYTIPIQLGQALQAIFASHEAAPGVQELAIRLMERLFPALPERQQNFLLDEMCIVDWLLEVVRNGTPVARSAFQCLQKHVFASSCFLQHHFEDGLETRPREGSHGYRFSSHFHMPAAAASGMCECDAGWRRRPVEEAGGSLSRIKELSVALSQTKASWPPAGSKAAFSHAAQIFSSVLEIHCSGAQEAWPASLADQAKFLRVVFSVVLGSLGRTNSPDFLLDRAVEFVKDTSEWCLYMKSALMKNAPFASAPRLPRASAAFACQSKFYPWNATFRGLLTDALRCAKEAQEPRAQHLSFPVFVVNLLLGAHASPNDWNCMEHQITTGFLELLQMDAHLLPGIDCEIDDDVVTIDASIISIALLFLTQGACKGVVFGNEDLLKFRDPTLQRLSSLCNSIAFEEWRAWSGGVFARLTKQA